MANRTEKRELLLGTGDLFQDGENIGRYRYTGNVFMEIIVTEAIDGTTTEEDGVRTITTNIFWVDGEKQLDEGNTEYELVLEDGRKLRFRVQDRNPVNNSYDTIVRGSEGFDK